MSVCQSRISGSFTWPIARLDVDEGATPLIGVTTDAVLIAECGWALTFVTAHTGEVGWKFGQDRLHLARVDQVRDR